MFSASDQRSRGADDEHQAIVVNVTSIVVVRTVSDESRFDGPVMFLSNETAVIELTQAPVGVSTFGRDQLREYVIFATGQLTAEL
jgi:ribosomal protein L14